MELSNNLNNYLVCKIFIYFFFQKINQRNVVFMEYKIM